MTALPTHCHRCPFGERHMRETVCTLDGRCVSLPDLPPEWCPLRSVATLRRERDEARAVIAAAVAALKSRSTGDLAADVAGLVELAGRGPDAERDDLRDSLDRLRARVEAAQRSILCLDEKHETSPHGHTRARACGRCPVCLLREEMSQ